MNLGRDAVFCILLLTLGVFGCAGGIPEEGYFPPPKSEGDWRRNTSSSFVRSVGIDPERLEDFGAFNLAVPNTSWQPYANHKGILVIKDGWIVGEWYNSPAAKDFRTYLSSNGKAFAMVAFGILVRDGATGRLFDLVDLESKVYDARWLVEGFPLSDPRKGEITFEMIFRHTSGLCPERSASGDSVEEGRDEWSDYVDWVVGHDRLWPQTSALYYDPGNIDQYDGRDTSGEYANAYSSVGFCHLGLVFRNIYQMPAHRFLWDRLLKPIGFGGIDFHAPPSKEMKWFSAGGLRMTPRDYARFAYLLIRDGRWKTSQIVPPMWIQRFRTSSRYPNIRSNVDGVFGDQYPKDMFRIAGSGLNWAFIVPSLDLIALRTGRADNRSWNKVEKEFLKKLFDSILPLKK
jgi:CubicO group peptidase (beta-lactamase class C family)